MTPCRRSGPSSIDAAPTVHVGMPALQYIGRPLLGRCVILPVGRPLPLRKGAVEPLARIRRRSGADRLR